MIIEEFNLEIRYLPGCDNAVADGLSRVESNAKTICYVETDQFPLTLENLAKE